MSYYYAQEAKKSNIVHERGHVRLGLEYTRCGKMLGASVGDGHAELRTCKACPEQPAYAAQDPKVPGLSSDRLRRRDLFAAAALTGWAARGIGERVALSVECADKLMDELDRTEEEVARRFWEGSR